MNNLIGMISFVQTEYSGTIQNKYPSFRILYWIKPDIFLFYTVIMFKK